EHGLHEPEVSGGSDLRNSPSHAIGVRDTEEAVVEAVVEEDGSPDTHAAAEAVEVAPGTRVRVVTVDEHEVERTGVDLHRAGVCDEDVHREAPALARIPDLIRHGTADPVGLEVVTGAS